MTTRAEREAEDNYEAENDFAFPSSPVDNSYVRETNRDLAKFVPVVGDNDDYDDPVQPPYANTDQQLEDDEREAISQSHVLSGAKLRHAKPRTANAYNEGPGEDELPSDVGQGLTGRSNARRAVE